MNFIQSLLENSNTPVLTAFLLGILTAISPCPLATNITAIGYISKNIESKSLIFRRGILYTLGRIVAYAILGIILIPILRTGASLFSIQQTISLSGEIIIAPLLIIIGVFMLIGDKLNLPKFGFKGTNGDKLKKQGSLGALFLGILFALAFCPTSGVFFFGMLIPLSAAEPAGYILPVVFAIATGLPVMLVAWVLAYSVSELGHLYNRIQLIQKWMNRVIASLFILIGCYYAYTFYL